MFFHIISLLCNFAAISYAGTASAADSVCTVQPNGTNGDSAPAIEAAFQQCGYNSDGRGKVVFLNETYTVKSVMNTTYLENVDVDLQGTLSWDNSNISYWLNNSLPVGYQNQSSAWLFGGKSVNWQGHGYGTLNGNGVVWYNFTHGISNYPKRPHQITIRNTTDSVFEGIRFIQSQMWTMAIISSDGVILQDIYVNNTAPGTTTTTEKTYSNTDGADTIYANNITFRRWIVDNGDDSISTKANSTNILIEDCEFYNGLGVAIGSIGQYNDTYETIQNVTARNITTHNMRYAAYFKTWTGVSKGYPPNGGGGGLGFASNISFSDFKLVDNTGIFTITQCTNYEGAKGDCDTSKFNIHNVSVSNWSGTTNQDTVASLQCSAASPCHGISIGDVSFTDTTNSTMPKEYLCDSVEQPAGFNCTGPVVGENPA